MKAKFKIMLSLVFIISMAIACTVVAHSADVDTNDNPSGVPVDINGDLYWYCAGNVDNDSAVTASDLTCIIQVMKGQITESRFRFNADLDCDGNVTASDVVSLINIIKGTYVPEESVYIYDMDHEDEFLSFLENPSKELLDGVSRAKVTYNYLEAVSNGRPGGYSYNSFSYEYTNSDGEVVVENIPEEHYYRPDFPMHESLPKENLYNLCYKPALTEMLIDSGIELTRCIEDVFIIKSKSDIPSTVVVVCDGEYYFIELVQYIDPSVLYQPIIVTDTIFYTYEEYYDKYVDYKHVVIDVCGTEIDGIYASFEKDRMPFISVMRALGAEVSYDKEEKLFAINFKGEKYQLGLSMDYPLYIYKYDNDGNLVEYVNTILWGGWIEHIYSEEDYIVSSVYFDIYMEAFGYKVIYDEQNNRVSIKPNVSVTCYSISHKGFQNFLDFPYPGSLDGTDETYFIQQLEFASDGSNAIIFENLTTGDTFIGTGEDFRFYGATYVYIEKADLELMCNPLALADLFEEQNVEHVGYPRLMGLIDTEGLDEIYWIKCDYVNYFLVLTYVFDPSISTYFKVYTEEEFIAYAKDEKAKLVVNGVEIEDQHAVVGAQYCLASITTILDALGAEFNWYDDARAAVYINDKTFYLNVERWTFNEGGYESGHNILILPGGSPIYELAEGTVLICDESITELLRVIYGRENYTSDSFDIDFENNIIYINT